MPEDHGPSYQQMQQAINDAIDRAMLAMSRLLDAKFETFEAKLERISGVASQVEDHESRLTGMESFKSAHERRIADLERRQESTRAWRRDHLPSLMFGICGCVLGLAGFLNAVGLL